MSSIAPGVTRKFLCIKETFYDLVFGFISLNKLLIIYIFPVFFLGGRFLFHHVVFNSALFKNGHRYCTFSSDKKTNKQKYRKNKQRDFRLFWPDKVTRKVQVKKHLIDRIPTRFLMHRIERKELKVTLSVYPQ